MMIWNNLNFMFPSNYSMELIYLLMDYTSMYLIMITFVVMMMLMNNMFTSSLDNTMLVQHELEMVWSVIPFLILIFISIPTLKSLYILESCEYCGLSVKVMGFQWYWSYSYMFKNNFSFTSYMDNDFYNMRLVDSDNSLMLPVNSPIRLMVTSNDVIHSWSVPSASVKMDAIPGRLNQVCFSFSKIGKFFGQCSEICGVNHSFMPISLEVLKLSKFNMMS